VSWVASPVIVDVKGTVRGFRQKLTLEDAIGSHACSLEAGGATNPAQVVPAGEDDGPDQIKRLKLLQPCDKWHSSRLFTLLSVGTVNSVQTL
jgi:hypothetical protein